MQLYSLQNKGKVLKIAEILVSALLFLLLYEWIVYGVPFGQIYVPASTWSDEAVYTKLLEAVVNFGTPQGYFGYNESHAEIGRYGAWGPVGTWIYAIPGFFLRGENTVLLCNLFFVLVGWLAFAYEAHLSIIQQMLLGIVLALLNVQIRYVFSAMQEPFYYASMLAVVGIGLCVRKKGRKGTWAALCVLCFITALARPYNIALWIYPIALAWPNWKRCLASFGGMFVSLIGTLALMDKMYAPYLLTTVDLGLLDMLIRLDVSAIGQYIAEKSTEAVDRIAQDIEGVLSGNGGGQYLIFLLLLMVTAICFIWDLCHKRGCFWKGCAFVFSLIVFLALLMMYPTQVVRHTLVLDMVLLATLAYESMHAVVGIVIGIGVLTATGMVMLAPSDTFSMPVYNENIAQEIILLQEALQKSEANNKSCDPWDHTLAYSLEGKTHTGMLYALPEGMGIQFNTEDYLSDTANQIHSRYIMTISGGTVEQRLIDEGWVALYKGEECLVYEKM